MSFLDRAMSFLAPMPPQVFARQEMKSVLDGFRESQAQALARLVEETGTRGAELAMCRKELSMWRRYARDLERACLAAGAELPRAPDDDG